MIFALFRTYYVGNICIQVEVIYDIMIFFYRDNLLGTWTNILMKQRYVGKYGENSTMRVSKNEKNGLNQEYENIRTEIDLPSRINEFKYCWSGAQFISITIANMANNK